MKRDHPRQNSTMKGRSYAANHTELSVCQEMVQSGVDLDLVCYGVSIDGGLKHKDRKMFLGLVKEMHDRGLKPDDVI